MGRLLLWVGLALVLKHHDGAAYKLVCYFSNWAHSRPGPASVLPQDLDPFLCTHLIFAFASMSNNQIIAKDLQDEEIFYPEFNKLKERNKELKTLLSIGGWNFGTLRFTTMLSTFANRKKFIDSVISFLRTHSFDGLDLFFLYPGLRGSLVRDRWTFLFLIEELLSAFQKEALLTNRPRLLLSAAVSGVPHIVQISYNVHLLGRLLDFINILSYDLHGSWEKFTGHNSPLFSLPEDSKSSAYAMNYWRRLGAPSEKLIMGLPTYGRTFRLLKASKNGLQAAAMGPASPGKYTKQAGFLAYYEVCSFVQRARKHWIDYQYVPYAYKGNEWVGYDDAISFSYKAMFVKKEHFGGAMVWTLDMDDVRGTFCGAGPFPLVYILNELLVQAVVSSIPLPQFWPSSAMNSSRSDSERLAVTKAMTTDTIKILPPGGEAVATEAHEKCENITIIPISRIVTPGRETVSSRKHSVVLGGKTEVPGTKTMTSVDHWSVANAETTRALVHLQTETPGEKTMTIESHQSVTPQEITMTPVHFQTRTFGKKTMAPRRNVVSLENDAVPRKMSVTPAGKAVTLQGENFTFEKGKYTCQAMEEQGVMNQFLMNNRKVDPAAKYCFNNDAITDKPTTSYMDNNGYCRLGVEATYLHFSSPKLADKRATAMQKEKSSSIFNLEDSVVRRSAWR
ncbi:oviduct-specific glycoprotein [Erethizon dorsatum]